MVRVKCALALFAAVLPLAAATKWDKKVEKTAGAVRAASVRAPGVAVDTQIGAAELLRATHPQLAWQLATAAAEQLKAPQSSTLLMQRVAAVLLAINPAEGEKLVRALPNQMVAYNALIGCWIKQQDPARAADEVKQAWAKGVYSSSLGTVLSALHEKRPEDAAALLNGLLDPIQPDKAALESLRALIAATQSIAAKDPAMAKAAYETLLNVVTAEKFNAEGKQDAMSAYRFGDKMVNVIGARDTFLVTIGIYLHSLDPDLFQKNEKLFGKWRADIESVKPGEEFRTVPVSMMSIMSPEMIASRAAFVKSAPRVPPAPPKSEPFADAWPKLTKEPDERRATPLVLLARRDDLTQDQRIQTTRELLRILPRLNTPARFESASEAFRSAADLGIEPLFKQAAQGLAATLADLERCKETGCEFIRMTDRVVPAYDDLAQAVRRSKLRLDDPAIAARASLIDLKDVLDENYDFKLAGIQGGEYALPAQKGRVIMLNFWATW